MFVKFHLKKKKQNLCSSQSLFFPPLFLLQSMAFSPFKSLSKPLFFLFLMTFLFLILIPCSSDPRISQAALICSNETAPISIRPTFVTNFVSAMDDLTPQIGSQRFARVIAGTKPNLVYAFGQCMDDLSKPDCDLCFAVCKTEILNCTPFQKGTKRGRNFLDGCYLRYDDYEFFGEVFSSEDLTVCNETRINETIKTGLRENLGLILRNVSVEAPKNDGFWLGSENRGNSTVYALGQCWKFVNESSCQRCLDSAVSSISSCYPSEEGRVLNAGCYLRYSTQQFYNDSVVAVDGPKGRLRLAAIFAICSSNLAVMMIFVAGVFFGKRKFSKWRERKQLGALATTINKSELSFKFEVLEKATNYFDNSNKLGQGGSGSVYKGILPDGRAIAIKRLFFNTRQWVEEFFNEVNLISGIHHKNLVKLLGCSITGPESLLVYEYVPNKSLHSFFDQKNTQTLSWDMRYNIIIGTAEGLAYLHEGLNMRIIHRDIKLSNILLDEDFMAKIADFGLARCFPEDKTHISTAVAGTLGYMAPEYLVRGKLTEKADVYSFGVVVIEVVCGRRNNSYYQDSCSIIQKVWGLYILNRLPEAVDPSLEGRVLSEDVSRVLQIGLLCTQASADLRPLMSMVVKMLTDRNPIPSPTQPPFLNSNIEVPLTPAGNLNSRHDSTSQSSGNDITESLIEPR